MPIVPILSVAELRGRSGVAIEWNSGGSSVTSIAYSEIGSK